MYKYMHTHTHAYKRTHAHRPVCVPLLYGVADAARSVQQGLSIYKVSTRA